MLLTQTLKDIDTGENHNSPVSYDYDLPYWCFEGGIIGISDPLKDTLQSYNQAVQRALTFYALNQNTEIFSVYEYYYIDDNVNYYSKNQKSHWIAEFQSKCENLSYKVEKIFHTKYNETIVLLNVSQDSLTDNELIVNGSFMYHYDCLNGKSIYGEKQLLMVSFSSMPDDMAWESTVDNNKILKKSVAGNEVFTLKNYTKIYGDYGIVTDEMPFSENNYGLWNSYIDTFFQALSVFEPDNLIVKNTSRYISQENNGVFEDKLQNILRSVIKTKVSCDLKSVSLKDSRLYAKWEIVEK